MGMYLWESYCLLSLIQLRAPKPPQSPKVRPSSKPVTVRKMKPQSELDKPKTRPILIAKPAPPNALLVKEDYIGMYKNHMINSKKHKKWKTYMMFNNIDFLNKIYYLSYIIHETHSNCYVHPVVPVVCFGLVFLEGEEILCNDWI